MHATMQAVLDRVATLGAPTAAHLPAHARVYWGCARRVVGEAVSQILDADRRPLRHVARDDAGADAAE